MSKVTNSTRVTSHHTRSARQIIATSLNGTSSHLLRVIVRLGLRQLVVMMRELEVLTTSMDIEIGAQVITAECIHYE